MTCYTLSNIRSSLAVTAPSACPEIYFAFCQMDECEQEWILAHVQTLTLHCKGMGPTSALELLYKVGLFIQNGRRVCPCCGQVI